MEATDHVDFTDLKGKGFSEVNLQFNESRRHRAMLLSCLYRPCEFFGSRSITIQSRATTGPLDQGATLRLINVRQLQ